MFIPPLERSGAIVDLDLAIFEQCCRFLRDRLDKGAVIVPLNCNFSRLHFLDDSFADALKGIVDRYAVPPSYLCAEITESAFVEDFDTVIGQVKRLHEHGFSVVMDDFGSGYSSLGMLQNLPIDEVKIDQLFFQRDLSDFRNATVVYSMANIAKVLGLVVVCEGIETAEQVEFVKGIGCDIAQGFFFSRPVDEASFGGLLGRAPALVHQRRGGLRARRRAPRAPEALAAAQRGCAVVHRALVRSCLRKAGSRCVRRLLLRRRAVAGSVRGGLLLGHRRGARISSAR